MVPYKRRGKERHYCNTRVTTDIALTGTLVTINAGHYRHVHASFAAHLFFLFVRKSHADLTACVACMW